MIYLLEDDAGVLDELVDFMYNFDDSHHVGNVMEFESWAIDPQRYAGQSCRQVRN